MPTPSSPGPAAPSRGAAQVPVKTILAVVGSVLVTLGGIELFLRLQRPLIWVAVALFFAVVLHPAVDFLVRRAHLRRSLAALLVFLIGVGTFGGLSYLLFRPLVDQVNIFVNEFPGYVDDAAAGRGSIGQLVKEYNLEGYVRRNQHNLRNGLNNVAKPAVSLGRRVLSTLTAAVTIIVITFLLLIEGPRMMESGIGALSPPRQPGVRKILTDASRALAGYVAGLIVTALLAGTVAYGLLWALSVPFAGALALWVGFMAVVPLVGGILGGIPAVVVAFIHSPAAGFTVIAVLTIYHLAENRTLGKWINARTVRLSPLASVVSVLAGLTLLGVLGALMAIPAAGVLNVVIRDFVQLRRQRRVRP